MQEFRVKDSVNSRMRDNKQTWVGAALVDVRCDLLELSMPGRGLMTEQLVRDAEDRYLDKVVYSRSLLTKGVAAR